MSTLHTLGTDVVREIVFRLNPRSFYYLTLTCHDFQYLNAHFRVVYKQLSTARAAFETKRPGTFEEVVLEDDEMDAWVRRCVYDLVTNIDQCILPLCYCNFSRALGYAVEQFHLKFGTGWDAFLEEYANDGFMRVCRWQYKHTKYNKIEEGAALALCRENMECFNIMVVQEKKKCQVNHASDQWRRFMSHIHAALDAHVRHTPSASPSCYVHLLDAYEVLDGKYDYFDIALAMTANCAWVGVAKCLQSLLPRLHAHSYDDVYLRRMLVQFLFDATYRQHVECVQVLLTRTDVDVNGHAARTRGTALMCAAMRGAAECAHELLRHPRIQLSVPDYDGHTALHIAAECALCGENAPGSEKIRDMLIERGARDDVPNIRGITARMIMAPECEYEWSCVP